MLKIAPKFVILFDIRNSWDTITNAEIWFMSRNYLRFPLHAIIVKPLCSNGPGGAAAVPDLKKEDYRCDDSGSFWA